MSKKTKHTCLLFLCISITMISVGCSPIAPTDPASTTFASAPPRVAPLFLLLSGWNTCQSNGVYGSYSPYNSGMYKPYLALANRIHSQSGLQPKLLATCFGKTSSFYMVVGQQDQPRYTSYESVFAMIKTLHQANPAAPVYIIGHSHGGWLSMHVAKQLGGLLKPRRLFTIDPISRNQCTPTVMTKAYISSAFSLHPAPGCTSAPPDFDSQASTSIRVSVGRWLHFYQSDYPLLHSSYQGFAHKNVMLQFDNSAWFSYRAHMQIAADPRVWETIGQEIFADLGL